MSAHRFLIWSSNKNSDGPNIGHHTLGNGFTNNTKQYAISDLEYDSVFVGTENHPCQSQRLKEFLHMNGRKSAEL